MNQHLTRKQAHKYARELVAIERVLMDSFRAAQAAEPQSQLDAIVNGPEENPGRLFLAELGRRGLTMRELRAATTRLDEMMAEFPSR